MGEKKKILFIINDFMQSGAPRYQYEVIKAINKNKYQVDIFSPNDLGSLIGNGLDKDYYYPFLKKIVNNIVFYKQIQGIWVIPIKLIKALHYRMLAKVSGFDRISKFFLRIVEKVNETRLKSFLNNYDVINVTDYNYILIRNILTDITKLQVHMMRSKVQTFPKSPFDAFDYNKRYNFVVNWTPKSQSFEFSDFKNGFNVTPLPLIIDTKDFHTVEYNPSNRHYKIGIFTRIDYQLKPLDPFFFALHLLICKGIDVKLYIFGAGNPSGLIRLIQMLSLQDNVYFEGHQEDIGKCLEKYKLNLVWFHAVNCEPAGYSAFEIMLREIPNIFWDFLPLSKHEVQGKQPLPFFWEIEKFVEYTKFMLENILLAGDLGKSQRKYILEHKESKNFIHLLEEVFDKIV